MLPARQPPAHPSSRPIAAPIPVLAALLGVNLLLAGCGLPGFMSHPVQARGNKVEAEQLVQLIPGTSTRADVLAVVGSPTARATFDDNTWIYIAELTKPLIGATNGVEDQQAVALTFDQGGVLRQIDRKGAADAVPITTVSRTTPTPGTETSFLQQLLGNVGKFSPGGTASRNTSNY